MSEIRVMNVLAIDVGGTHVKILATGPGGTIVPGASGLGKKHYVAARRSG